MNHCVRIGAKLRHAFVIVGAVTAALLVGIASSDALPSYARQTGQQCAACHNGFPELTPYGRLFKLNGYTFGGGQSDLPALAVMLQGAPSFTRTEGSQAGGAAPHYGPNNNFGALQSGSIFYGGAISSDLGIGAFAQATYDNVGRSFAWDNTDIRWAKSTTLGGETVFGVSLNNNPSVTDLWNSTPAWSFPFLTSALVPTQSTTTMIEGAYAQQVAGLNAYTMWNRLVYTELGAYSTLTKGTDSALGVNPTGTDAIKGLAPYWRVALQPQWGRSSFEVGTFGMAASINPGRETGFGTDHKIDVGFDAQYQFLADRNSFSAQASWITENQSLDASQALGNSTNSNNHLRSLHIKTSYYFDQTYGATLGYFRIDGSSDPGLYAATSSVNSPNTTGWIMETDYMPFNHGGPTFWPWLNMKIGLQYTLYTKFNGTGTNYDGNGRNAHDNNTLFLFDWIAF
jgi:hypothetical protein